MSMLFLSYSRSDQEIALRFAADLRRSGIPVWVDQIDIKASQRWDRSVETALRDSTGVLLILSPRSVASENVLDEVGVALDSNKPLIPVMIEACQPPLRLARVQFIDATRDYASALNRCREAIAAAGLGPSAPKAATGRSFNPALIDGLAQKLTLFLGPISRHVVEQESRSAADAADLLKRLGDRLQHASDRDAFLASARLLIL